MRSPRGVWKGPGDRMSVRDGLMALHGNPPTPSLVSFCSFGCLWGCGGLFAFPILCINSNMRKRNQLCGWNSSLVWFLPEVEQSVGVEFGHGDSKVWR